MLLEKRLIIDGQVFQTDAKDRGMGRYSVSLIQAIIAKHTYSSTEILLNANLKLTPKLKKELTSLFPDVALTPLNLMTTAKHKIENASTHNQSVIDEYLGRFTNDGTEIDYFITALFQEPIISVFPSKAKKFLLFYDLIPYLYHDRYSQVMQYENYLKRYRFIFEADSIFTISQTVADDLSIYLGIPESRLVRIDGAPISTESPPEKPTSFTIPKEFVLMPTSDDPRKNNLRAVLGFEEYCAAAGRTDLKLVITSTIHKRERDHLALFSKNLVFTGNLHETELNWLYEKCAAVLFVPESEGLGLPVLEAVEANKKIVCSSLSVFKEISAEEDVFFYCDHENQQSIALALKRALDTDATINTKEYQRILAYYSWSKTAERFFKGAQIAPRVKRKHKPKLAVFTPTPDGLSAIGKVTAESHPVMSEYFDIDYYIEKGLYAKPARPNYLQYAAPCYPAQDFSAERYADYDAVIYHIGNGDYHLESIKNALYLPGYAVLHDTNISEAYRVLKETNMMSEARVEVEERLNKIGRRQTSSHLTSILNNQIGVLTHSDYARDAAVQLLPGGSPAVRANLPTATPKLSSIKKERIIIGLAGIIADVKGIEVIEAIANDSNFNECDIRLFGFNHASQDTINRLNSYENVVVITNLSDFDFQTNISKLDIFVNYRLRYNGETSLSTIEAMRRGCVVFVKKVGWYDELPDNVVKKVEDIDEVLTELKKLIHSPSEISSIGTRACKYIDKEFTHKQYAEKLLELIESSSVLETASYKLAAHLKSKQIKSIKQYLSLLKYKT